MMLAILSHSPGQTKIQNKLTPKMTAVLTGHGMTKAYLRRFHLREETTCSCGEENQSTNQSITFCSTVQTPAINEKP
jgi:hypothetical protein